jgi:replicative DNA helicase
MTTETIIASHPSEWCAVRCCLVAREIPAALSSLRESDFVGPARDAWQVIAAEHGRGRRVNYATLEQALGKITALAIDARARETGADLKLADNYARDLIDASVRRSVVVRARTAAMIAMDDGQTAEEAVRALSADGIATRAGREYPLLSELLDNTVRYLEQPKEHMHRQIIPTGIIPIDDWCGGIPRGLVTILAGRPGTGKSTVALNIGLEASKMGRSVLYVSLEDVAHYLGLRAMASLSGIDYGRLTHHECDDYDLHAARQAQFDFASLPLRADFMPRQTASSIRATAMSRKHDGGLDLLIVDHLTEMANDHDAYASTSAQVKGIRDVAKECDCAVLLLCQLNRQGANRSDQKPQVTDLRDSGKIEEVARNIWLLCRSDLTADGASVVECNVAKATHGRTGVVNLRADFGKMKVW